MLDICDGGIGITNMLVGDAQEVSAVDCNTALGYVVVKRVPEELEKRWLQEHSFKW
jgi:hypothetical protein